VLGVILARWTSSAPGAPCAIRQHKGWTLRRAAAEAHLSPAQAWRVERGVVDSADALTRYARGLGASVDLYVRYQGADLERLLNRRHSAMHERMARLFAGLRTWSPVPEASFSVYGERGVVDWVAWHADTGTLLIVELKTAIVDVQDLVGSMNRRARLAPQIAAPYGWVPRQVATWVVVEDGRTNRRHVAQHAAVLRTAFPDDGRTVRGWLRNPNRPIRCLSFMPGSQPAKQGRTARVAIVPAMLPDEPMDGRMARLLVPDRAKPVS
jgi:transcriptional regulator with XRE-family HTH domain